MQQRPDEPGLLPPTGPGRSWRWQHASGPEGTLKRLQWRPPSGGLLSLSRRIAPWRSLALALIAGISVKLLFPRFAIGLTETTYFILAIWYIAVIASNLAEVFGDNWTRRLFDCLLLGTVAAGSLYLIDCAIRGLSSGAIDVAWRPAPLELFLFGCAGAIVETVVFQLGIQVRIRGWTGLALAALAFCVVHLSLNPFFVIAGITLATIQQYTGLPGAVIVAHLTYNALISGFPPR